MLRRVAVTAVAFVVLAVAGMSWATIRVSTAAPGMPPPQGEAAARLGIAHPAAHPVVVEPTAGVVAVGSAAATPQTQSAVSVSGGVAQPVSDSVIRQELRASGVTANPNQAGLTTSGLAVAPIGAPLAVQQVIQAGNEIARLPYVWGGGHGTYADTGYDCSGSISYVFAAAHLLQTPLVSGQLAHWGAPGPGKWITVFANAGHTFMYVAGLRFDTVALAETGTRWSWRAADESNLSSFAIRHPPGL